MVKHIFLLVVSMILICNTTYASFSYPRSYELVSPFVDVSIDHRYFNAIKYLYNKGVLKDSLQVNPDEPIKRAELVKIVLESMEPKDLVIKYDKQYGFSDIKENQWFAKYVSTAKKLGIISDKDKFYPDSNITCAEAYKIIIEAFDTDTKPSDLGLWFTKYMETAKQNNMIYLNADPNKEITRGDVFYAIYKCINTDTVSFDTQSGLISTPLTKPLYLEATYKGGKNQILGDIYQLTETDIIDIFSKKDYIKYSSSGIHIDNELIETKKKYKSFYSELETISSINNKALINIPITNKGIYMIRFPELQTDLLLNVSDIAVMDRIGQNFGMLWAVNIKNMWCVKNADVSFYKITDRVSKILYDQTDEDGVINRIPKSDLVILKKYNDYAFLLPDPNYQPLIDINNNYQAMVFTDKPVYKPGDTVYLKGIVKDTNNSIKNSVYKIQIESADQIIYKLENTVSEYGSFSNMFILNRDTKPGYYYIYIKTNDTSLYGGYIYVGDTYEPKFGLEIGMKKKFFVQGDPFVINLKNKEELPYKVYYRINNLNEVIKKGVVNLNDQGEGRIVFDQSNITEDPFNYFLKQYSLYPYSENTDLQFSIELIDGNNNPLLNPISFTGYYSKLDASLEGDVVGEKNRAMEFNIKTVDHDGKLYKDAFLVYKFIHHKGTPYGCGKQYNKVKGSIENKTCYRYKEEVVSTLTRDIDHKAENEVLFTPKKTGRYTLEVLIYDDNDRGITKKHDFYVTDNEDITINTDKKEYDYGDMINLDTNTLKSLVTVSQENIIISELVSGKDYSFKANYIPNIQVFVDTINGSSFESMGKNIKINPTNKKLHVKLTNNKKEVLPGDTVLYQIEIRDHNNRPLESEYSLAVIDKKILDIKNHRFSDIIDSFYRPQYYEFYTRPNNTKDIDTDTSYNEPIHTYRLPNTLKDTIMFIGQAKTDSFGKASVTFKLPDSEGKYAVIVVANSLDYSLGYAEDILTAAKNVSIHPTTPNYLIPGQTITLKAVLTTRLREKLKYKVELVQTCEKSVSGKCKEHAISKWDSATLTEGEKKEFEWQYTVPDDLEDGEIITFVFSVKDSESNLKTRKDKILIDIPIKKRLLK